MVDLGTVERVTDVIFVWLSVLTKTFRVISGIVRVVLVVIVDVVCLGVVCLIVVEVVLGVVFLLTDGVLDGAILFICCEGCWGLLALLPTFLLALTGPELLCCLAVALVVEIRAVSRWALALVWFCELPLSALPDERSDLAARAFTAKRRTARKIISVHFVVFLNVNMTHILSPTFF